MSSGHINEVRSRRLDDPRCRGHATLGRRTARAMSRVSFASVLPGAPRPASGRVLGDICLNLNLKGGVPQKHRFCFPDPSPPAPPSTPPLSADPPPRVPEPQISRSASSPPPQEEGGQARTAARASRRRSRRLNPGGRRTGGVSAAATTERRRSAAPRANRRVGCV